jgi:cyanate lyase
MMTKADVTQMVMEKKRAGGTTWAEIAGMAGLDEVFVTSACLGMNSLPREAADRVAGGLGLPQEAAVVLAECPKKVFDQAVPTDPCIYRFYEIVGVYGETLKELIQEKGGDGIMSAIDFDMRVEKLPHDKGDRIAVTMSGKFLPYKSW